MFWMFSLDLDAFFFGMRNFGIGYCTAGGACSTCPTIDICYCLWTYVGWPLLTLFRCAERRLLLLYGPYLPAYTTRPLTRPPRLSSTYLVLILRFNWSFACASRHFIPPPSLPHTHLLPPPSRVLCRPKAPRLLTHRVRFGPRSHPAGRTDVHPRARNRLRCSSALRAYPCRLRHLGRGLRSLPHTMG